MLIIVLHLSLPIGILYADVSGLRQITLPWGEQIVVAGGAPHPWRPIVDLFFLTMFAFFFYALARQYRGGNRRLALVLGLALVPLLVARVVDPLVVLGVLDSILTSELAFLAIVIAMSLVLSHGGTQTEIELHSYQQHLHGLVAARTAALTRANAQLTVLKQVADIGIRMNDLPSALQGMCEIATSLFDARSTLLLIPPSQATDRPMLVGFERGTGALGLMPVDAVHATSGTARANIVVNITHHAITSIKRFVRRASPKAAAPNSSSAHESISVTSTTSIQILHSRT